MAELGKLLFCGAFQRTSVLSLFVNSRGGAKDFNAFLKVLGPYIPLADELNPSSGASKCFKFRK